MRIGRPLRSAATRIFATARILSPRRERVEPLGDVFVEAAQIGAGWQRDDGFAQAMMIVEQ